MSERAVHLRPRGAITPHRTKTKCGRTISERPTGQDRGVVVTFRTFGQRIDCTLHGALVTCRQCLGKMR